MGRINALGWALASFAALTGCGSADDFDKDGTDDALDCAPEDPAVHPGATEQCSNGIDDDCNHAIDAEDSACAGDDDVADDDTSPGDDDTSPGDDDDDDGDDDTLPDDDDSSAGDDDTSPSDDDDSAAAGCPANTTPDCYGGCTSTAWWGNGTCNVAFNCSARQFDLGDCCTTHAGCGTTGYCTEDHECADVYALQWGISVFEVVVNATDGNGLSWDSGGGLPDPYVQLRSGPNPGTGFFVTTYCEDATYCAWPVGADASNVSLDPAGLCVIVWDYDNGADQQIAGGCWSGPDLVDVARAGEILGPLPNPLASVNLLLYPY